jgi:hypothetical protein
MHYVDILANNEGWFKDTVHIWFLMQPETFFVNGIRKVVD